MWRALATLCEPREVTHAAIAESLGLPPETDEAAYTELFSLNLYPYASVYLGPEGMLGGDARDRVAGFWRAVGHDPPAEPDHLAAMLGLYASLVEAEADEDDEARRRLRRRARHALLWEHLLSWLPSWLRVAVSTGTPQQAAWAGLLEACLRAEATSLGPPDALSAHLHHAPPLPAEDAAPREMIAALLAPVRTGIIVTRRDLSRAARELGLGLRIGERAFALEAMLGQDPQAALGWLGAEAARWEAAHTEDATWTHRLGLHWAERAAATAAFCRA